MSFVIVITDGKAMAVVGPFSAREVAEEYDALSGSEPAIATKVVEVQTPFKNLHE